MAQAPCLPRCLALLLALVFGGVLAALAAGPGGPGRVGAQVPGTVLWGATGGNTAGQLYRIDPTNGTSTLVGNLAVGGTPIAVTGLAVDPTTNVLYGATSNASPNFPVSLVTIDRTSAAATMVGPLGLTTVPPISPSAATAPCSESPSLRTGLPSWSPSTSRPARPHR